ncbi:interleukin-20 receptor subunit alpha-like isoform X2 [Ambystoma mexicanum]|uniref:interleukin-20 receptor subunit alpha-like isoform X2 n=1 Tax=Ambystoma mexicanum TaxID=8296 RepID=UPI0037E950B8
MRRARQGPMGREAGTARALPILAALLLLLPLQAHSEKQHTCVLPKPRNVHFQSTNMMAVLRWFPPAGLGDGVLYTVHYRKYGPDKWRHKLECTNINRTWCDLRNETYDYDDQYYARVMLTANGRDCSKWASTERFNPLTDSKIDPPAVKLSPGDRCISISLSPPEKWNRNPGDKSLYQIFPLVEFKVSILNTKTKRQWNWTDRNSSLNVTKLEPNSTYCITVESFIHGPYRASLPSEAVCATTLPDTTEQLTLTILFGYVLPAVLAVLLTSAIGYAVYRYIHADEEKSPQNLQLPVGDHDKFLIPEVNNFFSVIFIGGFQPSWNSPDASAAQGESAFEKNSESEILQEQHPGYVLQTQEMASARSDFPSYNSQQPCLHGASVPELESPRISAAEDYGMVSPVPDSSQVQQKSDLVWQPLPLAENPYKSQTNMSMPAEPTSQAHCPQPNKMHLSVLGMPEVEANWNPLVDRSHQHRTDSAAEEEPCGVEEECSKIVLDWDRHTGRLTIPDLPDVDSTPAEDTEQKYDYCDQPPGVGLLSKLILKQTSQENFEEDEEELCLLQFHGKWDLHVQME